MKFLNLCFVALIAVLFSSASINAQEICTIEEQENIADAMLNQRNIDKNVTYDMYNVGRNYIEYIQSLTGLNPYEIYKNLRGFAGTTKCYAEKYVGAAGIVMDKLMDEVIGILSGDGEPKMCGGPPPPGGPPYYCPPPPGGDHPDETTAVGEFAVTPISASERDWLIFISKLYERTPEYDELMNRTEALRLEFAKYYWYVENLTAQNLTIDNTTRDEFFSRFGAFVLSQEELIKAWEKAFDGWVLRNGYYANTIKLLGNLREYYPDVGVSDLDLPEYTKVLIIPTGGLYGLDSDEIFRAKLEKFVSEGGVLIVFAQQHGYEYRALPGGKLRGYGWAEDRSCTWGTVEISQHHPAFAGQGSLRVGANIDGYFTQWPENARILMTKRSSRWPVIIEYTYGKGRVIAMTLYTDWAYAHGQAARSEVALLRDLLAYARKPQVLPEYVPGDIARIPVNVSNRGNVSAREVVFTIIDPEKNILANVSMNLSLAPGESRRVEFEYLIPQKTGIYWVDYALVDASGNVTQVTYEAERFAVSSIGYLYGDSVIIAPEARSYVRGSTAKFNITVQNARNVSKEVEIVYGFVHNQPKFTENPQRVRVVLPAMGNRTITIAHRVITGAYSWRLGGYRDTLRVRVYENYTAVGGNETWFTVYPPSLSIGVDTDRGWYDRGDNVSINVTLRNLRNARLDRVEINVTVLNPMGKEVLKRNLSFSFSKAEAKSEVFNYTMPQMPTPGRYTVNVESPMVVNGYTYKAATSRVHFDFPLKAAVDNITIPVIREGNSTVSFEVRNTGRVAVKNATLTAWLLLYSDNTLVWQGKKTFDIPVNDTYRVNLTVSVPELRFGKYLLKYNLSYGKNIYDEIILPNRNTLTLSIKKPDYKVREAVNLSVSTANTGRFLQELNLTLLLFNRSFSVPVNLTPGESYVWNLSVRVPEEVEPGYYRVVATAALRGGNNVTEVAHLYIPESRLSLALAESNLSSGGSVVLNLSNAGGVDAGYALAARLYGPFGGVQAEAYYEGGVAAGGTVLHSLNIPGGAVNGSYVLHAFLKNLRTNESTALEKVLWIRGLNASIDSVMDKPAYFIGEAPVINTSVVNLDGAIENATLNLRIIRAGTPGAGESWPMFRHDARRSGSTRAVGEMRSAVVKWSFDAGEAIYSSPVAADVNQDGHAEIAFATSRNLYILSHNGSVLWNASLCIAGSSPAIADVDGDGMAEVVIHGCAGVFALDAQNGAPKWFYPAEGGAASPAVADLEGDGLLEVVAQGASALYVLNGNGELRWNFSLAGGGASPAVADVNGDGAQEVVALSYSQPALYVLAHNGSLLWSYPLEASRAFATATPAIADINRDGGMEVVIATSGGVYALSHEGDLLWNLSIAASSSPAIADVDGDGFSEVVVGSIETSVPEIGSGGSVFALDGATGMPEWSFPTLGEVLASPAIADIDGDGMAEVIVMDTGGGGGVGVSTVYAINGEDGSAAWSLPIAGISSPAIADVDGDGSAEVVVGSAEGLLHLLDSPEEVPPGSAVWERNITLSLADSLEMITKAREMNFTGKYYLVSSLYSGTGQLITGDLDSFYVVGRKLLLTLETDRRLYKPGEEVGISGEVVNLATIPAENLTLVIRKDGEAIHRESFSLAPNETHRYSLTAAASRSFVLEASAGGAAVAQRVEVRKPNVSAELLVPERVSGAFNATLLLKNLGEVDARLKVSIANRSRALVLRAGSALEVTERLAINRSTTVEAVVSGDVELNLKKQVVFLKKNASLKISPMEVYPPGVVEVPFSVLNTGEVPLALEVSFVLGNATATRAFHLPVNASSSSSVAFNLSAGAYLLRYSTPFEDGSVVIRVAEPENISLNVSHAGEARGALPVNITLVNTGAHPFFGELRVGTRFYSLSLPLNLSPLEERLFTLSIPAKHLQAGNYTLRAEVLRGGRAVESYGGSFAVPPASFEVLSAALDRASYAAGGNVTLRVEVLNTGGAAGEAVLHAELPGIGEADTAAWVEGAEERNLSLSFALPADLPAGNYTLTWRLGSASGRLPFSVLGANVSVRVTLNRADYLPNESVLASFEVENLGYAPLSGAWLRAQLGGEEALAGFNLSAGEEQNLTLAFAAPERSEKLFYGVYQESGRALLLGAKQVWVRGGAAFLRPEKELYLAGENVTIIASFSRSGRLVLRSPFVALEENVSSGERNYTFALPLNLSTGSYAVEYEFHSGNFTELGSAGFDVLGYSARILEARLSRAVLSPGEAATLELLVENNGALALEGSTSAYAYDGGHSLASTSSAPLTLAPGERKRLTLNFTAGNTPGVGAVVYALSTRTCDACAPLTLVAGTEFFRIPGGAVLHVGTSKAAYLEGEEVEILAEVFSSPGGVLTLEVYNSSGSIVLSSARELSYSGLGAERFTFTGLRAGVYKAVAKLGSSKAEEVFYLMSGAQPPSVLDLEYPALAGDYAQLEVRAHVSGAEEVHLHLGSTTLPMRLANGSATACIGPLAPGEHSLSVHALGAGGEAWSNFSLNVAEAEVKIKAKKAEREDEEEHGKHGHDRHGGTKFELEAKWKKGGAKGEFVLKEKRKKPLKGRIRVLYKGCDGAFHIAGKALVKKKHMGRHSAVPFSGTVAENEVRLWVGDGEYMIPTESKIEEKLLSKRK